MGSMQPDALGAGRQSHLPGASSAGGPATSPSSATRAVSGRADRGARDRTGRAYVQAVLERYVWLPVTPARVGPCDGRLARLLHQRGVPLARVLAALVIGGAASLSACRQWRRDGPASSTKSETLTSGSRLKSLRMEDQILTTVEHDEVLRSEMRHVYPAIVVYGHDPLERDAEDV